MSPDPAKIKLPEEVGLARVVAVRRRKYSPQSTKPKRYVITRRQRPELFL